MFSVWRGNSLQNVTGGEPAAGACVYGPRTTWTVALRELPAVHEFLLVEEASAAMREGRLFAPANYRSSATHEGYARLIEHWQREEFSLRYTGAAVVDVVQLLVKGCGVFVSPASVGQRAPLRLLYEAIPLSFLVEKVGGASSDGEKSILEIPVRNTDHRTQLALGSPEEVRRFDSMVGPSSVQGWLASSARSQF